MIKRIASAIEMSFDIPKNEKEKAQTASDAFEKILASLDVAKNHLDIIYEPFKNAQDLTPEAVKNYRGAIWRFKEQVKKNFNSVKADALKAIIEFNFFAADTHILELINSFRDAVGDLEKQANVLLDILDDWESTDFKNNIVKGVENVNREASNIEKLVKERVQDYIDANILAKNWMTNTGDELNQTIESKVPYITQLFLERQKALNSIGK